MGSDCISSRSLLVFLLYSIPMVHSSSSSTLSNLNISSQLASLDQILCVASLVLGKGLCCIRFWGRLDQNSGFHGNRKPPLTYNGENDVSTFSRLFFIRSFLHLQVKRTCIKSRTFRSDRTTYCGVSCRRASKKCPCTYNGKMLSAC